MSEVDDEKTTGETVGQPLLEPEQERLIEQTRLLSRRRVINLLLTLPILAMGIEKCTSDFFEGMDLRELQQRLANEKNEKKELTYIKDPVTGNYFKRDSSIWKLLEKTEIAQREIIPVLDCEGKPMLDASGRPVKLSRMIAQKLQEADKMIFEKLEKHVEIRMSFRTNWEQFSISEDFGIKRMEKGQNPLVAAQVGTSFHEAGFAVDVVNWGDAQKYLVRAGLAGGMYTDNDKWIQQKQEDGTFKNVKDKFRNVDANHFSCGELTCDINLVKGDSEGWMDYYDKGVEWTTIKKRLGKFYCYNQKWGESASYKDQKGWVKTLAGTLNWACGK